MDHANSGGYAQGTCDNGEAQFEVVAAEVAALTSVKARGKNNFGMCRLSLRKKYRYFGAAKGDLVCPTFLRASEYATMTVGR